MAAGASSGRPPMEGSTGRPAMFEKPKAGLRILVMVVMVLILGAGTTSASARPAKTTRTAQAVHPATQTEAHAHVTWLTVTGAAGNLWLLGTTRARRGPAWRYSGVRTVARVSSESGFPQFMPSSRVDSPRVPSCLPTDRTATRTQAMDRAVRTVSSGPVTVERPGRAFNSEVPLPRRSWWRTGEHTP